MKSNIIIFIIITTVCSLCKGQLNPAMDKNRTLFFSEDFNTLDLTKWSVANLMDRTPEPQIMTNRPQNIFANSGVLTFRTIKESFVANGKTYPYTSAWIQSYANYKYGYFEMRAICPSGQGYWPAFWLQKGSIGNCDYTEIDIFENKGSNLFYLSNANHYQTSANCLANKLTRDEWYETAWPTQILNTWHVWGCEWTPNWIIYYLDGYQLRKVPNHQNQSMPIILNQSLYHLLKDDGTPNPDAPNASTPLYGDYIVDYVKVYRTTYQCNTVATITDFNTYAYGVKLSITVGDGTALLSVPANQTVILRAVDNITINSNFEVPLGSEFEAINSQCY